MKSGLLSTKDVSGMLKVNESTVKRWTDKGSLRCIKTPGGHRKYKMKDVVTFMDHYSYDVTDLIIPSKDRLNKITVSTDYAILTKDFPALADIFFNTIVEGNRDHTFQYLHLLYANRISHIDLVEKIVFPAFATIGMKWMAGELGIEQEHLASNTAVHAILKLQDHIEKKPKHDGIAVCGCFEDEYHDIGITCISSILESNGWTTYYLGADLPLESFIDAVEQYVPDIVCVSSTMPKTTKRLVEDTARLFETAQLINARLIVGGIAANDKVRKKLTADLIPHSITELLSFIETIPLKKK